MAFSDFNPNKKLTNHWCCV